MGAWSIFYARRAARAAGQRRAAARKGAKDSYWVAYPGLTAWANLCRPYGTGCRPVAYKRQAVTFTESTIRGETFRLHSPHFLSVNQRAMRRATESGAPRKLLRQVQRQKKEIPRRSAKGAGRARNDRARGLEMCVVSCKPGDRFLAAPQRARVGLGMTGRGV
jgi:hypothetical protein